MHHHTPFPTLSHADFPVATGRDEPKMVRMFREATGKMAGTFAAKNADYGNSFVDLFELYERELGKGKGDLAILPRILDKAGRIENLTLRANAQVKDESVADTYLDLACYALMGYLAITKLRDG